MNSGYLKVSKIHSLYYELVGNKNSPKKVIYLHGGPGGGFNERHKARFPKSNHTLFFDQRGAGKSRPKGELKENNTQALVEDIVKLMDNVGFKKAIIAGHSWGTTLALCFAIKHPERVQKLVLSGTFFGTKEENEQMMKNMEQYSPELFEKSKLKSFRARTKQQAIQLLALELSILSNDWTWQQMRAVRVDKSIMIGPHYMSRDCFIPNNYIMKNVPLLRRIPIIFIHGQQDLVCPPMYAWKLHKALPKSKFILVTAGHSIPQTKEIYKKIM